MCSGPAYLVAFGKTTPLTKSRSGDRAAEAPSETGLDDAADAPSEADDAAPCTGCGRIPCDCDGLEAAHRQLWFPETAASGCASVGRSLLSLRAPVHVSTETFLVGSFITIDQFTLIPWYQSFHGLADVPQN